MPGMIVYHGPSQYDGKSIVAILVKSNRRGNRKTGRVIQQYILRADIDPLTASRQGADFSVCGNCKHRGTPVPDKTTGVASGRTCYVILHQATLNIYKAFIDGKYSRAETVEQVRDFIDGLPIRLGSYGDPACLPKDLNETLISISGGYTSYTHGHTVSDALGDSAAVYSMVSVESIDDAIRAHSKGYRTFRVIPIRDANKPLLKTEIMCPSIRGVKCADCQLCNGTKYNGKSIAIVAHGSLRNMV